MTNPRADKSVSLSIGGVLLCAVVLESSLLGSGRLVEFGTLTLKMWLFLLAQIYVIVSLAKSATVRRSTVLLVCSFLFLLLFGVFITLAKDADTTYIFGDISPSLAIFMLPFCELTINSRARVGMVAKVLEFSALLLSAMFLVLLFLILAHLVNFLVLYRFLSSLDREFSFRGTSGAMDYKGMIYVAFGAFFLLFDRRKKMRLLGALPLFIVLATFTRGLALGLVVVVVVHLFTGKLSLRNRVAMLAMGLVVLLTVARLSESLSKTRSGSDETRLITLQQIDEAITPASLFIGHGLAQGVPVRMGHFEIAYSEVFHKQGLLGLSWWAAALVMVIWRYRRARRANYEFAQPMMLGAIFVFTVSATNPYINNPIGMFILSTALASLAVLGEDVPASPEAVAMEPVMA